MSNGIIVGRFQTHRLHKGHIDLIETVQRRHDDVLLVLGCSPLINSFNNPLTFEARKAHIHQTFPDLKIAKLMDTPSDEKWSQNLDDIISVHVDTSRPTTLYGGRDSFIPHYLGSFETQELEQKLYESASDVRRIIREGEIDSADFRAGLIYASGNRYPTAFTTVDIGIFNHGWDKILLGKRDSEPLWRLPGGFSEPASPSFEADASREAREETGLEIDYPRYILSTYIDDWRYRGEPDAIKTLLFAGTALHEEDAVAGDDLDHVQWVWTADMVDEHKVADLVMPHHRYLVLQVARFGQARMMIGV